MEPPTPQDTPIVQGVSQPEEAYSQGETVTISRIKELLKTKNDTSRFVGLALLKSVLDNSQQLREDETAVLDLWRSVSPKFLDRLLRTGANPSTKDGKDMINIAVAVLHTFSALLSEHVEQDSSLVGRIPALVAAVLHSSDETTQLILQTLLTLVSTSRGAEVFVNVGDQSPLIEIAPTQPLALDVFLHAFAHVCASVALKDGTALQSKIDLTMKEITASFKGTDAVTLLNFVDQLMRRLNPELIVAKPSWLKPISSFVRILVTRKPTATSRAAYTNLTASLLQTFPDESAILLFSDESKSEKPFFYLLINLVLVDLRSSFSSLLEKLNSPDYEEISRRLTSAFDIISAFTGTLIRILDQEDDDGPFSSLMMVPDLLLKMRAVMSETMSLAIEYLRDRWDASEAGAQGLHQDARTSRAQTASGSHFTLTWESKTDVAKEDPLVLAAVRALAIWLREDDNDLLRKEAAGLSDMLIDLYKSSSASRLDFRPAVLVAFAGIINEADGVAAMLENDGWEVLMKDLLAAFQASSSARDMSEAARGIEIVRVLLPVVEGEESESREAWMALVTTVAAWNVPDVQQQPMVLEFQVVVLQLVTALLANTHTGMQRRYTHSISAMMGIVKHLKVKAKDEEELLEALADVETTLGPMR